MRLGIAFEGSQLNNEAQLIASLRGAFEQNAFVLCDEPGAHLGANFRFRISEVFDGLVPSTSEVQLLRGSCVVTVFDRGRKISSSTVCSKVTGGRDRDAVRDRVAGFLRDEAIETAARLLEPLVE